MISARLKAKVNVIGYKVKRVIEVGLTLNLKKTHTKRIFNTLYYIFLSLSSGE